MIRHILAAALCLHLGAGLFAGLLMQRSIPALNPAGVAYIAMTWPRVLRCARSDSGCDPAPPDWLAPYLFSFPDQ